MLFAIIKFSAYFVGWLFLRVVALLGSRPASFCLKPIIVEQKKVKGELEP